MIICYYELILFSINKAEPITPLTLDRIRSMIDTCKVRSSNGKGTPNYELLEQAIQKAFSNWYILNESFSNVGIIFFGIIMCIYINVYASINFINRKY